MGAGLEGFGVVRNSLTTMSLANRRTRASVANHPVNVRFRSPPPFSRRTRPTAHSLFRSLAPFSGTVLENLFAGALHASLDAAYQACKLAGVHEAIEALPQGY